MLFSCRSINHILESQYIRAHKIHVDQSEVGIIFFHPFQSKRFFARRNRLSIKLKIYGLQTAVIFFISNGLSLRHCHFEQHQFVAPLIILLLERNQRKLFDRMISCTDLIFKRAIDRKVQLHLSRLFGKLKVMVQLFYTPQNKHPQCGRQNDRISKCNLTLLLCKCACANVHRYYSL